MVYKELRSASKSHSLVNEFLSLPQEKLIKKTGKMKGFLGLLVFVAAIYEIKATMNVTVYYESMCPDCRKFISRELYPAMQSQQIRDFLNVELLPFGKARYTVDPFTITCHHGDNECVGNFAQVCAIARYTDILDQVNFLNCVSRDEFPPTAGPACAEKLGLSYDGIEECANGDEGVQLTIEYGIRTQALTPKLRVVPTIVFNNQYNDEDQKASVSNFKDLVCRKMAEQGIQCD